MSNDGNKIIYSMIGVSKTYDKKVILKDIYLSYFYGAKIGVLGLNGSGKSTLLRILAGVDTNFDGQISKSPGYTVGFLEQEPKLDETLTVRQVVEQGMQPTIDLLKQFDEINEKARRADGRRADEQAAGEAGRRFRKSSITPTRGTSISSSRWRWTPCAARRAMRRSRFSAAARSAAWRSAGCCCRSRTFCCSMSRRITSMPSRSRGWSSIWRATRARSSPSRTTAISSTTSPGGSWSSIAGRAFRGKGITPPGSSRRARD